MQLHDVSHKDISQRFVLFVSNNMCLRLIIVQYCHRLLAKFVENEHEKTDRAVEVYYRHMLSFL